MYIIPAKQTLPNISFDSIYIDTTTTPLLAEADSEITTTNKANSPSIATKPKNT